MSKSEQGSHVVGECRSHVIRLHGPWQVTPLACTSIDATGESVDVAGDLPPAGTVNIPADWAATIGPEFRGRVLYERRFGRPSNLGPGDRVDLVLYQVNGLARISLDGRHLGNLDFGERPGRFEITNYLRPRNTLQVEVNLPQGRNEIASGGIVGEVHLAIYEVIR